MSTVSGVLGALAIFVPGLSSAGMYLYPIFVISVHVQPWLRDSHTWLRCLSVIGLAGYVLFSFASFFGAFILIPILTTMIILLGGMFSKKKPAEDRPTRPERQTPKPAVNQGDVVSILIFIGTQLLTFINPFQLVQMIIQTLGLVVVLIRNKGVLADPENYIQQVDYRLPVQGEWYVANGGVTKECSHSWDIFNQRYAYDLIIVDENTASHKGNGKTCVDYYCYEQKIVSPAAGEIVKINDSVRDAKYPGTMALDFLARDFRGNFVVIKHCDREYSFLAHLIPGSIEVKVGDKVEQGQLLGKCGNSGHSTEPHLHFHVQDSPNFFFAAGLPIKFSEFVADGVHQERTYLSKGQRIRHDTKQRRMLEGNHASNYRK